MDSNVSKNTNSHNFFKISVDRQKLDISVKNLLKQELLFRLDVYQQKFKVEIKHELVANILEDKIFLVNHKKQPESEPENALTSGSANRLARFVYGCPIGFYLCKVLHSSPSIIVRRLGAIKSELAKIEGKSNLELWGEIAASGWIYFPLDDCFISSWLEQLLQSECFRRVSIVRDTAERTKNSRLFSAQYVSARCCSLLRLAIKEKAIALSQTGQMPRIDWLDRDGSLLLSEPTEIDLLRQLLKVSDFWVERDRQHQWSKLVLDLSETTAVFLADCRFLGEVKHQHPQQAIARLGLIFLCQIWLEKILRQKLGIAAPEAM